MAGNFCKDNPNKCKGMKTMTLHDYLNFHMTRMMQRNLLKDSHVAQGSLAVE